MEYTLYTIDSDGKGAYKLDNVFRGGQCEARSLMDKLNKLRGKDRKKCCLYGPNGKFAGGTF
ncbi:hypothetical protein KGP36_07480 [Patescibacteria group bacterium]|nr:hypothetical protein [Patescibacteria group bacterium]